MLVTAATLSVLFQLLCPIDVKVPVQKTPQDTLIAGDEADTARVSGTPHAPVLGSLIPTPGLSRIDSLAWWPPALAAKLAESGVYVYRKAWAGQQSIISGLMAPGIGGSLWFGFPVLWQQELGGELGAQLPASADGLGISPEGPMLGAGNSTVFITPWLNEIMSPRTRFEVLGGPLSDRYYAFSFGTGIASSLSSLFSVVLRSGGGARTNSDYSTKQYDWRIDLDPPFLDACRIFTHYSSTERGVPGVDPRLWITTYSAPGGLDPNFWALDRGYGASDAMWLDDREAIKTRLLSLQTTFTFRDQIPVNAAFFTEQAQIDRRQSVPFLWPDSLRTVVDGVAETKRDGLLARVTLAQSRAESLWLALCYDKITRDATFEFDHADSTWNDLFSESESAAKIGVGIGGQMFCGSVTATDTESGTRFAGSGEYRLAIGDLACLVGTSVSNTRRGLDDVWRWKSQSTQEPELDRGASGVGWASLERERELLSTQVGVVAGHSWDAWGWCASDSLPPGRSMVWGPENLSVLGATLGGTLSPTGPLRIVLLGSWLPWRGNGDPVPYLPDLRLHTEARYSRAFGTAAIAHLTGVLRYIGTRYTGLGRELRTDPVWVLNGQAEIEIGDFTILCLLENLTGHRYEEVRGYPIEGLYLQLGFHWQFWD